MKVLFLSSYTYPHALKSRVTIKLYASNAYNFISPTLLLSRSRNQLQMVRQLPKFTLLVTHHTGI